MQGVGADARLGARHGAPLADQDPGAFGHIALLVQVELLTQILVLQGAVVIAPRHQLPLLQLIRKIKVELLLPVRPFRAICETCFFPEGTGLRLTYALWSGGMLLPTQCTGGDAEHANAVFEFCLDELSCS